MRLILLLLVLLAITVSCKKEIPVDCSAKTNDMEKVRKFMSGTYSWVYSTVRFRGSPPFTETPASTGISYKYVFKENGTVDYHENNALKSTDNYIIDYEFKVSRYPRDSATIVIIKDKQTDQRKEFFRPWLCNDSACFYNPYSSIDVQRYFKRN